MKQIQISFGIPLNPGENEVPDEIATELIKGSDALIASLMKVSGKTEEEVREERKGKGIFTEMLTVTPGKAKKKEVNK